MNNAWKSINIYPSVTSLAIQPGTKPQVVIPACTQGNGILMYVIPATSLENYGYTIRETSHPIHKYRYDNNIMSCEKSRLSMQQYMYRYDEMFINYVRFSNLCEYHEFVQANISRISFWEKPLTFEQNSVFLE